MNKTRTIAFATTISLIGLFGCSKGPSEEELKIRQELQSQLEQKEAEAARAAERAAALEEAKRLAEEAAEKAAEAEQARLVELAAQVEREKAERARLAGLVDDLNSKSEAFALDKAQLEQELAAAAAEREAKTREVQRKLEQAQAQLAASEAQKQAEIEAARKAAIEEATARMEARADRGGYTAATDVVTNRGKEDINAFLDVEISERNYHNHTRRLIQRREAGE